MQWNRKDRKRERERGRECKYTKRKYGINKVIKNVTFFIFIEFR